LYQTWWPQALNQLGIRRAVRSLLRGSWAFEDPGEGARSTALCSRMSGQLQACLYPAEGRGGRDG
jgi:hypothetical protein